MIVGHGSIEGYSSRLQRLLLVSASLQRRRCPDEAHFWMAATLLERHIVSNAVSMAINSFQGPMIVGHGSIEASLSRLKRLLLVSASLHRRR
eukprot:scaffold3463_cov76-Skeletonema_marinoi.AAC.1